MVQKAGVREDAPPSEDELQRFGGVHAALDHQVSDEQCCRPGDTNNAMDEYTASLLDGAGDELCSDVEVNRDVPRGSVMTGNTHVFYADVTVVLLIGVHLVLIIALCAVQHVCYTISK